MSLRVDIRYVYTHLELHNPVEVVVNNVQVPLDMVVFTKATRPFHHKSYAQGVVADRVTPSSFRRL